MAMFNSYVSHYQRVHGKITILNGKIIYKLPFSIAMSAITRGYMFVNRWPDAPRRTPPRDIRHHVWLMWSLNTINPY